MDIETASEVIEVKGSTGTVRFDGHAVTIIRKGFWESATVGKGVKQIPLAQITAVQFKPATLLTRGFIQFTVPGGVERRSKPGTQFEEALRDENSVVFTGSQRGGFEALRDAVQAALLTHHSGASIPAAPAPANIPEQIKQLADLASSAFYVIHTESDLRLFEGATPGV